MPYVVLTKYTAEIASRKENQPTAVATLYTWLFSTMQCDHIDFRCLLADHTYPRGLISIHSAFPGT